MGSSMYGGGMGMGYGSSYNRPGMMGNMAQTDADGNPLT